VKRGVVALIAAAGSIGCRGKAAPQCDELRALVDRLYDLRRRDPGHAMTAADQERAAAVVSQVSGPMKDAIVIACRDDGWPDPVLRCMRAVATPADLDACKAKLAAEPRARFEHAIEGLAAHVQPDEIPDPIEDDDDPLDGGAADCAVLAPMIDGLLAEQLRDAPAGGKDTAAALAARLADPMKTALIGVCRSDGWSAAAIRCMGAARSGAALAACEQKLTPAQLKDLGTAMDDATASLTASRGVAPTGGCDAYLAEVNALLACDRLPAADRGDLQRRAAMVADGLKKLSDPSLPAAARASIASQCATARDAIHAQAQRLGCAPT